LSSLSLEFGFATAGGGKSNRAQIEFAGAAFVAIGGFGFGCGAKKTRARSTYCFHKARVRKIRLLVDRFARVCSNDFSPFSYQIQVGSKDFSFLSYQIRLDRNYTRVLASRSIALIHSLVDRRYRPQFQSWTHTYQRNRVFYRICGSQPVFFRKKTRFLSPGA
jgi:hypothetical protein